MILEKFQNLYRMFRPYNIKYNNKVLKSRGVKIGRESQWFSESMPSKAEANMISIGDYTNIGMRVIFLTHDGAIGTHINRNPKFIEKNIHVTKMGKISVGNHVFIGDSSIILPSVTIGDFSIIAAGSVVTKNVPGWEVWGGVPAKFIKSSVDWVEEVLKSNQIYMKRREIEKCLNF